MPHSAQRLRWARVSRWQFSQTHVVRSLVLVLVVVLIVVLIVVVAPFGTGRSRR